MSFQEQVKNFSKSKLKKTSTSLKTEDGRLVQLNIHDLSFKVRNLENNLPGFIVDNKPDLTINEILPGLYLSGQDVARDLSILKSSGITHILNLAPIIPCSFPSEFAYKTVELLDVPETDLISSLEDCLNFIDLVLKDSKGNVLVHCNAGVSRLVFE
ncbi:DgyrCDS13440 [Dimorphilus gyrociliatus]|uniref:DgyrCDS13440 n=1 Tax=Dimorphilus gyrociliatus TaxID=2664684 RepID=A0A7I8WAP2_9ANNE|nr:DgyrCDS13440 [Dimorphilus gyrociliatus]